MVDFNKLLQKRRMKRTDQQQNYIDEFLKGKTIKVQARAGTGKTATIVEGCKEATGKSIRVAVFNKKNEEEMKSRLPSNTTGSTWHSLGRRFLPRNVELVQDKMKGIIDKNPDLRIDYRADKKDEIEIKKEKRDSVLDLVRLCKNTYIDPTNEDMLQVINHYGITSPYSNDELIAIGQSALQESDKDTDRIDFDDMIRFPVIFGKVRADSDIFIGDEAQDNVMIRTLMAKDLQKQGCQIVFVGDEAQSIYGFTGADVNSMKNIDDLFNPLILPLSINFRCGKNIIKEAQKYVPDIEAWDQSVDGNVTTIQRNGFLHKFAPGDCALSRTNRAMIPLCFKLIRDGKKATIQGADFKKKILGLINGFSKNDISELYQKLDLWRERNMKYTKSNSGLEAIEDTYETLRFFADQSGSVQEMITVVGKIFSDEITEYKFSTAHRSKGLEWKNVFIIDSDNFMMTRNKKPWELQQEQNLVYVAVTRAKENLVNILAEKKESNIIQAEQRAEHAAMIRDIALDNAVDAGMDERDFH